jgi:hypothetical protein
MRIGTKSTSPASIAAREAKARVEAEVAAGTFDADRIAKLIKANGGLGQLAYNVVYRIKRDEEMMKNIFEA